MSRTLEEIVSDARDEAHSLDLIADAAEGLIREAWNTAYAIGAASRSGESEVGWIVRLPDERLTTGFLHRTAMGSRDTAGALGAEWEIVRVRITVEPEEGT